MCLKIIKLYNFIKKDDNIIIKLYNLYVGEV